MPSTKEIRQTADSLAEQLGETESVPKRQLYRVVQTIGTERALAFLTQTLEVENQGGMMLPDNSRRRTPGGVYFKLVRDQVSNEERQKIFPSRWARQRKQAQQASPAGQPAQAAS